LNITNKNKKVKVTYGYVTPLVAPCYHRFSCYLL
jgi:hypothetical protein